MWTAGLFLGFGPNARCARQHPPTANPPIARDGRGRLHILRLNGHPHRWGGLLAATGGGAELFERACKASHAVHNPGLAIASHNQEAELAFHIGRGVVH